MRALLLAGLAAAAIGSAASCARQAPMAAPPVTLAVDGRSNAHVTLAAEGAHVAAAWLASNHEASDVFLATSDDGGAHFGAPVRVNDIAGDAGGNGEQPPQVARQGAVVTVVWVSKRDGVSGIRAAQSLDGGRTFSASRTISPSGLTGARGWESAVMSPDGTVHAAWLDGRNAMVQHAEAGHEHGSMRQDIVHAMWRGGDPIVESPVAANVCFCCKTAVVTRGDDVFVAWRHLFEGGVRDIAVAHSGDGGRTFGAPVRVSADNWKIDACPDDGPSLAIDGEGTLWVAWPTLVQDNGQPHMGIFEAASRDGGRTFSPRARVDTSSTGASHPRVGLSGTSHAVVWDEAGSRGHEVMLRDRRGTQVLDGDATYPAIAGASSAFVVAWTEKSSDRSVIRIRMMS